MLSFRYAFCLFPVPGPGMTMIMTSPPHSAPSTTADSKKWVWRHSVMVRVTHWINAVSFFFLLWSGIAILYAFPQFHWGQTGYVGMEPALKLPIELDTQYSAWGRQMHFAFAWLLVGNGLLYLASGLVNGHFRRHLIPAPGHLRPSYLLAELQGHLPWRRHSAHAAYNVPQRLSYLSVIFVLLPLIWLTGLTMSPTVVAVFPWLTDLFGGRQSARFVHFIAVLILVLFVIVHLVQVIATGAVNQLRAMITGRLHLPIENNDE